MTANRAEYRLSATQVAVTLLGVIALTGNALGQAATETPAALHPLPPRPLLYFFEHAALPKAAFNYDQDIQALIANPRQAGRPMARIFAKAAMQAARTVPNFDSDTMFDDMRSFIGQIKFDTIQRGGYTIHLMQMPPPEYPNEAYFTAIVYQDNEPLVEGEPAPSTRYITFERTAVEGRVYALGEWYVDGEYQTHGFGDTEPTVRGFIANIYVMLGIDSSNRQ